MFRASVAISLLSTLGSLVSFAAQLAIARQFGAGTAVDTYLIAASVPTVLIGLFGAMLSFSAVPMLVRLSAEPSVFQAFAGALLVRLLGAVALLMLLGYITSGWIVSVLGDELLPYWRREAEQMARLFWFAAGTLVISSYLSCILTAQRAVYLPVVTAAFPFAGVLIATLWLAPQYGVRALPYGMLAGALAGASLLTLRAWRSLQWHDPEGLAKPHLRRYGWSIPAALAAMSCFTSYPLIDAYWAPELGPANLSYLGYSQRLLIAVGNLAVAGPSALLVLYMANASRASVAPLSLMVVTKWTFAVAAGISIVFAALAEPAVSLLFQRGSFDATATKGVASVLQIMLVGMAPMLAMVILLRGFFQLEMTWRAALLGLGWNVIYVCATAILSRALGAQGIAWAYVLAWWAVLLSGLALLLLRRDLNEGVTS